MMKIITTMTKTMKMIRNTDDENTRYGFLKTMTRIGDIHYCIEGHSVVRDDDGFDRIEKYGIFCMTTMTMLLSPMTRKKQAYGSFKGS